MTGMLLNDRSPLKPDARNQRAHLGEVHARGNGTWMPEQRSSIIASTASAE